MIFESISEVVIKWQKDIDNAILGEIKRKAIDNGIKTEYVLNEKAIISALEKQIPKKVEEWLPFFKAKCPSCNGHIEAHASNLYCCRCGQALDWSDTE